MRKGGLTKTIVTFVIAFIFQLFLLESVTAGGMHEKDGYQFHYSAFTSTFLTPATAKNYGIKRSRYRGVVNISVLDSRQNQQAVSGQMTGTATNLLGNKKQIEFREITEGKAIYYIAEFGFSNEETFTFDIDFKRNGKVHTISFRQIFYAD